MTRRAGPRRDGRLDGLDAGRRRRARGVRVPVGARAPGRQASCTATSLTSRSKRRRAPRPTPAARPRDVGRVPARADPRRSRLDVSEVTRERPVPRQRRSCARARSRPRYDVVIIGGGVNGLSIAYNLAANHGITNVAVFERAYIGSGGSGRNTQVVRANYNTPETVPLYKASLADLANADARSSTSTSCSRRRASSTSCTRSTPSRSSATSRF